MENTSGALTALVRAILSRACVTQATSVREVEQLLQANRVFQD